MAIDNGLALRLSKVQAKIFASTLQRSQLQVKVALADRMDNELRALDDKYKSRTTSDLEADINRLADRKEKVAKTIGNIEAALDKFVSAKTKLFEMRDAAANGNAAVFDVTADSLNFYVGSAVLNPDNMIGSTGQGTWGEKAEVFSDGVVSTTVRHKFLGNDYVIQMADGSRFTPDFENQQLQNSGTSIAFASLNLQSIVGDTITFDDGVTTYSGTLVKGGGEIMSSWQYNDFAAQADRDSAKVDIDAAIKRMNEVERQYKENLSALNAMVDRYSLKMEDKTAEYKAESQDLLDAKKAERAAIRAKFDFTLNDLSLTSNIATSFIQGLFLYEDPSKKQGLFDVIMGPT